MFSVDGIAGSQYVTRAFVHRWVKDSQVQRQYVHFEGKRILQSNEVRELGLPISFIIEVLKIAR